MEKEKANRLKPGDKRMLEELKRRSRELLGTKVSERHFVDNRGVLVAELSVPGKGRALVNDETAGRRYVFAKMEVDAERESCSFRICYGVVEGSDLTPSYCPRPSNRVSEEREHWRYVMGEAVLCKSNIKQLEIEFGDLKRISGGTPVRGCRAEA